MVPSQHPLAPLRPAPPIRAMAVSALSGLAWPHPCLSAPHLANYPTTPLLQALARWHHGRHRSIRPLLSCAPARPCHGCQHTIQPLLGCASTCSCPVRPLLDRAAHLTPAQSHEDEPSHGMSKDELVRLFPRDRVAPHICGILASGMTPSPLVYQPNTTKTRTAPSHPTLSLEPNTTLE